VILKFVWRAFFVVTNLLGFVVCVGTILSYFGEKNWLLDLLSHFRVLFFCYLLLCIIISLRQRLLLTVWCLFALLNLIPVLPFYIPESAEAQKKSHLSVMTVNLESICNHNFDRAAQYIKSLDPDIVSMQEIDTEFANYLKINLPQYRYSKFVTESAFSGAGLLSKYPLEQPKVYQFGQNFPMIASVVKTPLGDILVFVVHPLAPYSEFMWRNETTFADGIAQLCKTSPLQIILLGDLNTTPFSFQYRHMLAVTGLKDGSKGFGYQPTWLADLPILGIDHCLLSKNLVATFQKIGPNILSDHLPLYVEIAKSR
jgi:endonuclease/exonuclease/phosphatase (EEP) superfamily protein YafD